MAFLPRACVTKEQLADLSIYLHSLSYLWGSENMGENSETPTEFCGVHPSVHTSDSEIPQTLSGPVWVCRAERRDVMSAMCGLTELEGTQRVLWSNSPPPG